MCRQGPRLSYSPVFIRCPSLMRAAALRAAQEWILCNPGCILGDGLESSRVKDSSPPCSCQKGSVALRTSRIYFSQLPTATVTLSKAGWHLQPFICNPKCWKLSLKRTKSNNAVSWDLTKNIYDLCPTKQASIQLLLFW